MGGYSTAAKLGPSSILILESAKAVQQLWRIRSYLKIHGYSTVEKSVEVRDLKETLDDFPAKMRVRSLR